MPVRIALRPVLRMATLIIAASSCSSTDDGPSNHEHDGHAGEPDGLDAAPPAVTDAAMSAEDGPAEEASAAEMDATTPKGTCDSVGDCRFFSNYCGGCTCEIFGKDVTDPVCTGTMANCLVDPCSDKLGACSEVHHTCVMSDAL